MDGTITRPIVEIYTEITPEIPQLYHYTSQAGLVGILQNRHLWFTNIHFMNDSSEYNYAINFIRDELKNVYDFDFDPRFFDSPKTFINPFTFSLSEEKDLLSQWRGYCPDGGFSISFFNERYDNHSQLSRMIKSNNLYLGKCIYDEAGHKELIAKEIIRSSPEDFKRYMSSTEVKSLGQFETKVDIISRIARFAPLIKHETFKEEREWRIVRSFNQITNKDIVKTTSTGSVSIENEHMIARRELRKKIKFRQGKSHLVPYLEIPLVNDDDKDKSLSEHDKQIWGGTLPVEIMEVVLSPNPNFLLAKKAVEMLLIKPISKITESKIPYRNW